MEELNVEIARDLLRRERAGESLTVEMGPWSVFMVVAECQKMVLDLGVHRGEPFWTIGRTLMESQTGAARDAAVASWHEVFDELKKRSDQQPQ